MRNRLSLFPIVFAGLTVSAHAAAQAYGQPATQPGTQPYGQPSQPYQPSPNGDFQAGGLAPPTPMGTDPSQQQAGYQTETERQLTEAEQEDSGRGLEWIYFNVEGGYEYLGLETLKSDGLTYGDTVSSTAGGPMIGAGAGVRLIFITLGGRARLGMFDQWNLATINAEVGFHFPLGELEPHIIIGAGYAFLGSMDADNWGGDASVRGFDARAGFGLDYYVTPVFSIGANLTGEALFLKRPGVDLSSSASASSTQLDAASREVAESDGSSIGAAFTGAAVLGLHF